MPGFLLRCITICVILLCGLDVIAVADIKVTASSPTHPMLIRNIHGPLVKVVVEITNETDYDVNLLEFLLSGTDAIEDFQSLALFSTGANEKFSTESQFGDSLGPAAKISFRGKQTLNIGRNVFWLAAELTALAESKEARA